MADDTLAGTGQKSQLWVSTDATTANLFRLHGVTKYQVPAGERQFVDVSDLDSDAHEYAPQLPDVTEVKANVNYRAGSDTDEFLDDASADQNPRAIRMITAVRGVLTKKYDFLGYVTYTPAGDVSVDGKMEGELSIRVTGAITPSAYP